MLTLLDFLAYTIATATSIWYLTGWLRPLLRTPDASFDPTNTDVPGPMPLTISSLKDTTYHETDRQMKESTISKNIRTYLNALGARSIKYHGGPWSEDGIPDLLVCYRGRFLYIETKRPGNKATTIQLLRMRELDASGAIGGVATSLLDATHIIDRIDQAILEESLQCPIGLPPGPS